MAMAAAARRRVVWVVWVVMVRSFGVVLAVGLGGLGVAAAVPVPAKGRGQGVVARGGLVDEAGPNVLERLKVEIESLLDDPNMKVKKAALEFLRKTRA